ncbi:hypothetical protein [Microbacterium sp. NIBRBAC000506063]|uniref:hypothetical protein n=1 Tax=Microbacterium sp. NIBRBAC000506063 TaxID=2734618 RepID=UPI001BB78088|nr:hypothetical protein [Microbacterium sp. NIBRBAC000506063]QTV79995.1 hypothetical protein KAE78_02260 [Microbacterium sp. NIBRBAC000506063]
MVVGACVHRGAVDQEAQRSGEVLPCAFAAFVFLSEPPVDVGETGADAVLVAFEGVQVDGVGEVGCEQLVALVLEALAVGGEFCDLGLNRPGFDAASFRVERMVSCRRRLIPL